MAQLLTKAQAQQLDDLLSHYNAEHIMFIRYDRDYEIDFPALFEIEPVDLMRALAVGYEYELTAIEYWQKRYKKAVEAGKFIQEIGDHLRASEYRKEVELIAKIDADFNLGIVEMGAE